MCDPAVRCSKRVGYRFFHQLIWSFWILQICVIFTRLIETLKKKGVVICFLIDWSFYLHGKFLGKHCCQPGKQLISQLISNFNRTECCPIRSIILQVITKLDHRTIFFVKQWAEVMEYLILQLSARWSGLCMAARLLDTDLFAFVMYAPS